MAKRRVIGIGVVLLILAVATWLVAAAVGSRTAEKIAVDILPHALSNPLIGGTVEKLEHKAGLFSSNGLAVVVFPALSSGEEPLTITLEYTVYHLPLPSGINRLTGVLTVAEPTLEDALGGPLVVGISGSSGLFGAQTVIASIPELAAEFEDVGRLILSPATVQIQGNASDLQSMSNMTYAVDIPVLTFEGRDGIVRLQGGRSRGTLEDPNLQTGVFTTDVDTLVLSGSLGDVTLSGIQLAVRGLNQKGVLDHEVSWSLKDGKADGHTVSNATLHYRTSGLLAQPLRVIHGIWRDSSGFARLTDEQARQISTAAAELLRGGMSFGVTKTAGSVIDPQGRAAAWIGALSATLAPTQGDAPIALEQQLSSTASLQITGDATDGLDNPFGLLKKIQNGLEFSYEFKGGALVVNGAPFPAPLVQAAVGVVNRELDRVLKKGLSADELRALFGQDSPDNGTADVEVEVFEEDDTAESGGVPQQ